ncbi:MAG: histidinol-phosphate transaminase [Oscillospiraceae bacterium]|nr:histidinol-phosphate transaminase [Oscillospiraceae bacterium]
MSRFLSNRLKALKAYVPGEQPSEKKYIKLNTNESPYAPAPGVIAAVGEEELKKLNLYPNPDGSRLIKKLAEFYGVAPENVIIGNGSDELLAFAFHAFCDSERGVAFPDITYSIYPVYADLYRIPYTQIELKEDFSIDPADYLGIGKNIVIANPNAPTGIELPQGDIEAIARSNPDHVALIDEAYVDFGAKSAIPMIHEIDNLLVMHTYSKSRSMAGARMSFAIAPAPLIEDLNKMKYSFNPYNVNRLTQVMGEVALDEEPYYVEKRHEIIKTRTYTEERLRELGFSMTESKANFIFAKHPKIGGRELYVGLKEKGILVRHWDKPRISDYIRITIGEKWQMDALIDAIS